METYKLILNRVLNLMEVSPFDKNLETFIEYAIGHDFDDPAYRVEVKKKALKEVESNLVSTAMIMLGWGVKKLAEALEVTPRLVQKWESGSANFSKKSRLAVECLLRREGKLIEKHTPKKIGKRLYFQNDTMFWDDAIEVGGFYFDRARYLGLPHPLAMIVSEESFPGVRKSDVLEAQGVYHELFKNAEADLVTELIEVNDLEEVPGHG